MRVVKQSYTKIVRYKKYSEEKFNNYFSFYVQNIMLNKNNSKYGSSS